MNVRDLAGSLFSMDASNWLIYQFDRKNSRKYQMIKELTVFFKDKLEMIKDHIFFLNCSWLD